MCRARRPRRAVPPIKRCMGVIARRTADRAPRPNPSSPLRRGGVATPGWSARTPATNPTASQRPVHLQSRAASQPLIPSAEGWRRNAGVVSSNAPQQTLPHHSARCTANRAPRPNPSSPLRRGGVATTGWSARTRRRVPSAGVIPPHPPPPHPARDTSYTARAIIPYHIVRSADFFSIFLISLDKNIYKVVYYIVFHARYVLFAMLARGFMPEITSFYINEGLYYKFSKEGGSTCQPLTSS